VATVSSGASACGAATGNSTRGIFVLGFPSPQSRNKYTYASDTNSVATASSSCTFGGAATGNSTRGIFAIGNNGVGASILREKYTYACDTNASAASSGSTSQNGSAASNGIACVNV
jgi:hypothetical protein